MLYNGICMWLPWKHMLRYFDNFVEIRPMLYNGICMRLPWKHMLRYFDQCIFCQVHSIVPINMCTNFEDQSVQN